MIHITGALTYQFDNLEQYQMALESFSQLIDATIESSDEETKTIVVNFDFNRDT